MRALGVECFKEQLSKSIARLIIFTFPFLQKSSVLQDNLNFYKDELRLYICEYAFVNMPLYVCMHMHAYRETYRYNSMQKNQQWVLDISQKTFVNFASLLSATENHLVYSPGKIQVRRATLQSNMEGSFSPKRTQDQMGSQQIQFNPHLG